MSASAQSKKLFISYSHKDSDLAHGIARHLRRRNFEVWIDSAGLHARDRWASSINEAIEKADLVIGILTADSVRRPQVIRELSLALDKAADGGSPPVLFCVVGRIHDSWFYDSGGDACRRVIEYLHKYQYISFNAHADVTTSIMEDLVACVTSGELVEREEGPRAEGRATHDYVNASGMPRKACDQRGTRFHKVYNDDLAPSTVYPFALDNQWVPRRIKEDPALRAAFAARGFADPEVDEIIAQEQIDHLKVSLMHARQIIVNNSAILNSKGIRSLYVRGADESVVVAREREAFSSFLRDGSIVVFLYGSDETSPYVGKLPEYETDRRAILAWNELCDNCRIYCIRENWSSGIDQHSIDFVRFCCTISDDMEGNIMLARSLGIREHQQQWFLATLKDVSVEGFVRTRLTGTNAYDAIRGLSRSYFYKSFVVREPQGGSQPVLNCLFDERKPFAHELKAIVDTFYNSLFTNYFQCHEMLPLDEAPENLFLSQLYLAHGDKQVTELELEYAISEFLVSWEPPVPSLEELPERDEARRLLAEALRLESWSLDRIERLRRSTHWLDYIDTKEAVISRIQDWCVDFCDVNLVGKKLYESIAATMVETGEWPPAEGAAADHRDDSREVDGLLDYASLRIGVGTSVIDLVIGEGDRRMTVYEGTFAKNQNHLLIYYQPGEIGRATARRSVLAPMKVFDGLTDMASGECYFANLIRFFEEQGFEEVTD